MTRDFEQAEEEVHGTILKLNTGSAGIRRITAKSSGGTNR